MKTIFISVFIVMILLSCAPGPPDGRGYITASSALGDQKDLTRSYPERAFDNDPKTAWLEGIEAVGAGRTIGLPLAGLFRPARIAEAGFCLKGKQTVDEKTKNQSSYFVKLFNDTRAFYCIIKAPDQGFILGGEGEGGLKIIKIDNEGNT